MYGVELLLGAELNILDYEGHIDLEEFYWKMLDIRIAGIHSLCYQNGTIEQNTSAMLGAIRHPYVQIISHPGQPICCLNPLFWQPKKPALYWKLIIVR